MGEKHPNYERVQKEIKEVKQELAAWAAAGDFGEGEGSIAEKLPSMNDRDMRQLIVQLVGKIQVLENRIDELESPAVAQADDVKAGE